MQYYQNNWKVLSYPEQAPEAKVNAEKEKLQKYEEMMEKVNTQLKQMEK